MSHGLLVSLIALIICFLLIVLLVIVVIGEPIWHYFQDRKRRNRGE